MNVKLPRPTQVWGTPIPKDDPHAISVEYPTWNEMVDMTLGQNKQLSERCKTGYPRFHKHELIEKLEHKFLEKDPDATACSIFPSRDVAERCQKFIEKFSDVRDFRIEEASSRLPPQFVSAQIAVLFYPEEAAELAANFWAIFGEGISSRQAEYFLEFGLETKHNPDHVPLSKSIEVDAKATLKDRLSKLTTGHYDDIYLYTTGMAAVFHCHLIFQDLTLAEQQNFPTVLFGFAFKDTPKVLAKWGPGVKWYPHGSADELEELEEYLKDHRVAGLICEIPSNPLLASPNLEKIRALAEQYNFLVAVDDTLGNITNVNVMKYTDIAITSLTKIFSGACNVMGGSLILSPEGNNKELIVEVMQEKYVDLLWAQDAVVLEKNSRDVEARVDLANHNTEAVVKLLQENQFVKRVYYPYLDKTKSNYEQVRREKGGYGSLITVTFKEDGMAAKFYDALDVFKGPSLGTNFTLCIPFAYGAHWRELDFVESVGISRDIVRIAVGLEPIEDLTVIFEKALKALI